MGGVRREAWVALHKDFLFTQYCMESRLKEHDQKRSDSACWH